MSALAAASRKAPLEVGDQFLKFEIRGLLGQGGHGWVYHGYDPFLDRHVAIKVIPNPGERGRDLGRRAQLEARVLCKLQHRNVVHVIDAGATAEGAVYIVMELLHGRTLRDAIRDYRQLSVADVLWLGAQVADGVQAAHEQNAIHRDLKPENVFVLQENAVKVLDFGIAKFLGAGAATTQRDLLHGTILYMSPEHLQGFRVTARSDIYALGTTLYEALAGRPPCLVGMEEPTLESVTFAQLNRMPQPLDVLTGTVPRFVARAVQRMLAKEPADRFATMAEVAEVLRAHLHRFVSEVPHGAAAPRKLWQGTHSISPASGAVRLSQTITDVYEFGPTTSPSVNALIGQARDSATPLQFSLAPAVRAELPLPISDAVPRPLNALRTAQFGNLPPDLARPPITLAQLLLSAVALGSLVGVAVALIQTVPRSAPPIAVSVSAARSSSPAPTASGAVASASSALLASATPAALHQSERHAAPATPASSAMPVARAGSPTAHPHIAARAVSKPVMSGPASGLGESSVVDFAKKANAAPTTQPIVPAVRHPKAIYGSDDGAE